MMVWTLNANLSKVFFYDIFLGKKNFKCLHIKNLIRISQTFLFIKLKKIKMSYINIFITFNDVIKQNEICLVWYVDNVFF